MNLAAESLAIFASCPGSLPKPTSIREALSNKPAKSGLSVNLLVMNSFRADQASFGQVSPPFGRNLVQFRAILSHLDTRLPYSRLA